MKSRTPMLMLLLSGMPILSCSGHTPGPEVRSQPAEIVTPSAAGEAPSDDKLIAALTAAAGEGMSGLNEKGGRMLLEVAQGQACPCPGRTRSLAECIGMSEGKACARAPFAARAILRALGRGEQPKKIAPRLLERFGPVDPEVVKLDRAPCRGKKDAPATLVVISDFQCLYCAMGKKLVEELERRAKERLRVCFLNWPLTKIHPLAKGAARAAVAAQLQGKFWPMHDLLFENRGELQREDLLSHAKEIGLDLARFEKDMDSAAVEARVELDITEARRLRMRGTPAFLINGRRYTDPKSPDDFMDWIEEAEATGVGEGLAPSRAGTSPAPTN